MRLPRALKVMEWSRMKVNSSYQESQPTDWNHTLHSSELTFIIPFDGASNFTTFKCDITWTNFGYQVSDIMGIHTKAWILQIASADHHRGNFHKCLALLSILHVCSPMHAKYSMRKKWEKPSWQRSSGLFLLLGMGRKVEKLQRERRWVSLLNIHARWWSDSSYLRSQRNQRN